MSTIPSASSASTDYSALGLTANSGASKKKTLGQDDFLKLMTTQIQNQDPLKPMENTEFFSQIAQFSTVSGIEKLQGSFSDLATQLTSSQALDASSLIGRNVLVPSSVGVLDADGLAGAIDVPGSGTAQIQIRDGNGVLVRTLDLGSQPAGQLAFEWNGTDAGTGGCRVNVNTASLLDYPVFVRTPVAAPVAAVAVESI